MNTSQIELIGTPQFDSGRWKLRLERMPISPDEKSTCPLVSGIALGLTIFSPLIFLIGAYVWALVGS